ncbi:MAG: pseudouridine synthase [Cyclobacteriaceae bacterium]
MARNTRPERSSGNRRNSGRPQRQRPAGRFSSDRKGESRDDEPRKPRTENTRPGRFASRGESGSFSRGKGDKRPYSRDRDDREKGSRPGFRKPFGERSERPDRRRDDGSDFPRRGKAPFSRDEDKRPRARGDARPAGRGFRKPYGDRPQRDETRREDGGEFPRSRKPSFSRDESRRPPARGFRKSYGDRPQRDEEGGESPRGRKSSFSRTPPRKKSFVENRKDLQRHRKAKEESIKTGDGLIRLNKFISNSGVCSRREADELIKMGLVSVNGTTITEMGYKVKPTDDVRYEGKKLTAEKPVYILLNKPKGFITTTEDPQERHTVMGLIAGACKQRVYPVGRLDRNTTGLLLLTNDGDLADKLTHPSYNVKKIYKVELDKPITKADFETIAGGVQLEEGKATPDDLAIVSDDKKTLGIELHIGWNRIVRRIFEAMGYEVLKLDRVVYAGLDKKDLPRGKWRMLKDSEVVRLKHLQ